METSISSRICKGWWYQYDDKRWNNIYQWQLFSTGSIVSKGTFLVSQLEGGGTTGIQWVESRDATDMLTNSYRTISTTNNYLTQSATMEKPWSILLMILLRMAKWTRFLIDAWFESTLPCPNAHLNLKLEFTSYISSLLLM